MLHTGSSAMLSQAMPVSVRAALVLSRFFDPQIEEPTLKLIINSPHIKQAMRDVIGQYPGVNINTRLAIILLEKPFCLFHYRNELREYALASDSEQKKDHVLLCLKYMEKSLQNELDAYESMMANTGEPGLEFKNLWMAFKPGCLLFKRRKDVELVVRLIQMEMFVNKWQLTVETIQGDGKAFGIVRSHEFIDAYDDMKFLTDLKIYPLEYHKEKDRIREELIARGRKYVSLSGIHHRLYEGVARSLNGAYEADGTRKVRVCLRFCSRYL